MEGTGLPNSISPRQAWLLRPSPDGNLKVEWGTAVADASTACEVRRHEEPAPVSEDWHFARMGFVSEAYRDHGIEVVYVFFQLWQPARNSLYPRTHRRTYGTTIRSDQAPIKPKLTH
jgi:hypothetical protein